jgi:hypothetical protein
MLQMGSVHTISVVKACSSVDMRFEREGSEMNCEVPTNA